MAKAIKLYTLNTCSLVSVTHTSIKLFFKKGQKSHSGHTDTNTEDVLRCGMSVRSAKVTLGNSNGQMVQFFNRPRAQKKEWGSNLQSKRDLKDRVRLN